MKFPAAARLWLALAAGLAWPARAGEPVTKIVSLLEELKQRVEEDGKAETKAYDTYACWCEDTLSAKAAEITAAKDLLETLQGSIVELQGDIATHNAEIVQLKKDIAANLDSQREATEMREKESASYQEEKTESEQCIGALEAAITVLAGAGTGKKMEELQEAQLLSVVAGVRDVLRRPAASRSVKALDLQVVRHFVEKPEDFVGGHAGYLSAAQIANNPYGDYAPQSTQIQGILKGMYDSFTGDLEKANVQEAQKQKGFEELMQTKKAELKTLETTLNKHTMDLADKTKGLADKKTLLEDTQVQLKADQAFFVQTKGVCEEKATQLAQRTRLRTEELMGIGQAIAILSSPEAKATFTNASATFLQLSSTNVGAASGRTEQGEQAYQRLRSLASRYTSVQLARLAMRVRSAGMGHFDAVIDAIDSMIALLRKEEQQDIADRDWCQHKTGKNKNDMEDLNYDIEKANSMIQRLGGETVEVKTKMAAVVDDINATEISMAKLLQMRIKERNDFIQSVKDDTDAVALLEQAIAYLSKFFKRNSISLTLAQARAAPAANDPPPVPFTSGEYTGRTGEHEGIIAILGLVKEDFEKEILTSRQSDAAAQVNFEKDRQAMQEVLAAYKASKVSLEQELADLLAKITDIEEMRGAKNKDLTSEKELEQALTVNCAWVETHFDSRRTKRKAEIDGLIEAKSYLAGSADDDGLP